MVRAPQSPPPGPGRALVPGWGRLKFPWAGAAPGRWGCLARMVPGRGRWLARLEGSQLVPGPARCIQEIGHKHPLSWPGPWVEEWGLHTGALALSLPVDPWTGP